MEGSQVSPGQTVFRGKMSKVLRLSIRDLPSFAAKSPATMSILRVTPKHSTATQQTIEYVKGLLLQSSQALTQNQQVIKGLLAERNRLLKERDSRPTAEEFALLQEQLNAQREMSRMDRIQIKQLQALSEQQDLALSQAELRFHETNQAKLELATKIRSLRTAQSEHNVNVAALERQLQLSKEEMLRLHEELRSKAEDLQNCQEKLKASIVSQNELKNKFLISLSKDDLKDPDQTDCGFLLKSLYHHTSGIEKAGGAPSYEEMAANIRLALDHYRELRDCSVESFQTCIKRLCSYLPSDLTVNRDDTTNLVTALENYLISVNDPRLSAESLRSLEEQCCQLRLQVECDEHRFKESTSKLESSNQLVATLQDKLKIAESKRLESAAEVEKLRSRCASLQLEAEKPSNSAGQAACRECISRHETFKSLENQLSLLSQEFVSLQSEMVEMRSKASAHVSVIKDKDLCIERLQEEVRLLSAAGLKNRTDAQKENVPYSRVPLSNIVHK